MIIDRQIKEGTHTDEDGTMFYFADFVDGQVTPKPLRFEVTPPDTIEFYTPVEDAGVSHCEELVRFEPLTDFLKNQVAGKYRIAISAYMEVCVAGWWAVINSISFSNKADRDLFTLRFGK